MEIDPSDDEYCIVAPETIIHCDGDPVKRDEEDSATKTSMNTCTLHPTKQLEYFDTDCAIAVCGHCIAVGAHKGHDVRLNVR